jgi:tetratricopeptide (TPR) repeat protein
VKFPEQINATSSRLRQFRRAKSAVRLLTESTMNISSHEDLGKVTPITSNGALESFRADARNAAKKTAEEWSVEAAPATWSRLDEAHQFVSIAIDLQRDGRSLTSGRYAKRALSLFERESRIDDYEAIVARLCLADSRVMRRDFDRAETDYRAALSSIGRLMAASGSFDDRNVRAHASRGLASVALAHGEPQEAERQLLQALDLAEQKAGASHESDAMLMDDLGTVYRQTGRYDDAARIQHLALTVIEETVGIEHPQAATILEHLAMLEHARGQFTVGERFAREAAAIQERAFGPDHPRVANAFVVLALMLEGRGKLLEATEARQAAQLIAQRWFGDDLQALAGSGLMTATTHSRSDRPESAEHVTAVGYA